MLAPLCALTMLIGLGLRSLVSILVKLIDQSFQNFYKLILLTMQQQSCRYGAPTFLIIILRGVFNLV